MNPFISIKPAFTADWFSLHIPLWTLHLKNLAHKPGLKFLEVGSYEGRSAVWLLQNVLTDTTSRLTCVDNFNGIPGYKHGAAVEVAFDSNIASIGAADRVIKMKGESWNILPKLPFGDFDLCYVDGCHRSSVVLSDAVDCWRLLKVNGILIFDDYLYEMPDGDNPKTAIDGFLASMRGMFSTLWSKEQVAVRKLKSYRELRDT